MTASRRHQGGISLLIVIVIVLLTMLMAVRAARTALFNERIVGNDADYQRTFEAAQAMLQDAELDILGQTASGGVCAPSASDGKICRRLGTVRFIDEDKDFVGLLGTLEARPDVPCTQGICAKRSGKQDFWNDRTTLERMRQAGVGARYGEFTGARKGSHSNPILQATAAGTGAWYWVEVMPYATGESGLITHGPGAARLDLHLNPNVIYRITALAQGLRPGSQVVLQSTLARQKRKD